MTNIRDEEVISIFNAEFGIALEESASALTQGWEGV